MLIRSARADPHRQLKDPSENQMADHAAAIELFMARPVITVEGTGARIHLALSVVDSASAEHPDTEVTLVAAGTDAESVRRTACARYGRPNEDSYDRVPALWATYVLSVPVGVPLDVVLGTIESMATSRIETPEPADTAKT